MTTICQQTWWQVTAGKNSRNGRFFFFLVFMFWAKCKYEAKPFLFFPPTMGQQTRPFFCLAVHQGCCGSGSEEQVYWHQESISGPALPLPALPFTLALGDSPCQTQIFPGRKMTSLELCEVHFYFSFLP